METKRKLELEQALIDLTSDKESTICEGAVTLALNAKKGFLDSSAISFLTSLLSHTSEKVRQSVIAALTAYAEREYTDSDALRKLISTFYKVKRVKGEEEWCVDFECSDINRAVGIACIEKYATKGIYDPAAVDLLMEILKHDKSVRNRILASSTLEKYAAKNMLSEEKKEELRVIADNEINDTTRITLKRITGIE